MLDATIERAWFFEGRDTMSLADHLSTLAHSMLEQCGPVVRLAAQQPDDRAHHADAWRRLSLYLPTDMLIAARSEDEPLCDHVTLLDPLLARVLESRVAETHLHVGAGMDFSVLWLAVLHDLTWGNVLVRDYQDVDDGLGGGSAHARILRAAMLTRHTIFMFLWHRSECNWGADFRTFLHDWLPRVASELRTRAGSWSFLDAMGACWSALHVGPVRSVKDVEMRSALRHLAGGKRPRINGVQALVKSDPLTRWLIPRAGRARPETRLLWHALRYLRGVGKADVHFADAFWQYVRVRALVYGRLVETPGTAGLDWFSRHFEQIKRYRVVLDDWIVETAQQATERGIGLESIEVRTAPGGMAADRTMARALAKQMADRPGRSLPQVGLILHFIKPKESAGEATPEAKVYTTRYGRWFAKQMKHARGIGQLLDSIPEMLVILRGIDCASSELGVPNWPLVPIFAKVREHARRAACKLATRQPHWQVEGLSTTLHLGEEFRRLSDGLRRIHEAVEFGLLGVGDRIGHGLALGWSARAWADANPCVPQPRDERLDDLLWTLDRYERRQVPEDGRHAVVRAEAGRLIEDIYGRGYGSVESMQSARHDRFVRDNLHRLDYPRSRRGVVPQGLEVLHTYLSDGEVHRRGAELIDVHVDDAEVSFLDHVQFWLRQQLALLGVTIESNPSSNLLIGDFPDLQKHPTFRLSPLPGSEAPLDGRLPVSINTDDPITFATCLADEYAYMYFALIGQGVPTRDALEWLGQAREAGWRSRFTLPVSAEREVRDALKRK